MATNKKHRSVAVGRLASEAEAASVGSVAGVITPATATEARGTTATEGVFRCWIPGRPVAASRPRVARNGGVFYPPAHVRWSLHVTRAIDMARQETYAPGGGEIHPGFDDWPVLVAMRFLVPVSKRWAGEPPVGDLDNLAKLVLDACTAAGLWHDDRQVVRLTVSKTPALDAGEAGVELMVQASLRRPVPSPAWGVDGLG